MVKPIYSSNYLEETGLNELWDRISHQINQSLRIAKEGVYVMTRGGERYTLDEAKTLTLSNDYILGAEVISRMGCFTVGKEEVELPWSPDKVLIDGIVDSYTTSSRLFTGLEDTTVWNNYYKSDDSITLTDYAFGYCQNYTNTISWSMYDSKRSSFLPSCNELVKCGGKNFQIINDIMEFCGGTKLSANSNYWNSVQRDAEYAGVTVFYKNSGGLYNSSSSSLDKTKTSKVRPFFDSDISIWSINMFQ